MQYREMGNTGKKVSVLGFGMMRLPVIDNDVSRIDESKALEMVNYALENGVNYLDTAYPYHKEQSETFTAKVLASGWRDKVYVADKLPSWLINQKSDLDKYLFIQLKRLGVDYIDFYLLHALNKKYWKNLHELDVLSWLEEKKRQGIIREAGFSFHDKYPLFEEITASYNWDFCQIQYNYMDTEFQAGQKGLDLAADKGLGVIVMEPLRGGLLAKKPPRDIVKLFEQADYMNSPASIALRWIWQKKKVSLLLSGMSTLEQVKENVKLADARSFNLAANEINLVASLQSAYKKRIKVPCTGCEYCLPCPHNVAIPAIFNFYNTGTMYDDQNWGKKFYKAFIKAENQADKCVACGLCQSKCPQQIKIIAELKNAHEYLMEKL